MALGTWEINVVVDAMPQKVATAVSALSEQLVGAEYTPIAYLGSQVVKGINQIFAAEVTPVVENPTKKVAIVIVNAMTGEISITDLLTTKTDSMQLGYAFTWLKRQNSSLGAPLGEWP